MNSNLKKSETNNSLISVIVPVYNVEKYLDRCIESICGQTYKNLEIIIVNDGSTDSSKQKCLEWKKKDNRILYFEQKNSGQSSARNTGLLNATGEWIAFVDSDDYIDIEMYSTMMKEVNNTECQICVCGTKVWNNGSVRWISSIIKDKKSNNIEGIRMLLNNDISTAVWNKIFRRELFSNIIFPVGKIYEDEYVTPQLFMLAEQILYIDTPFYNYEERSGSILRSGFNRKQFDRLDAIKFQIDFLGKISEELKKLLIRKYYYIARDIFSVAIQNRDLALDNEAYSRLLEATKKYYIYSSFYEKIRMAPIMMGKHFSKIYFSRNSNGKYKKGEGNNEIK